MKREVTNEVLTSETAHEHVAGSGSPTKMTSLARGLAEAGIHTDSDAKDIKLRISFKTLIESDGYRVEAAGSDYKCRCPFHAENTPSFTIYEDARGHCYGCNWHGDIIAYEQKRHNVDFKTALDRLAGKVERCVRSLPLIKKPVQELVEKPFSLESIDADYPKYIHRLATEDWIRGFICDQRKTDGRKWNPDTLKYLAEDGSLGWAGDALAFIYPTGIKYRKWPEKQFFWRCEGTALWRSHVIANAQHLYITESETDAISLIDSGVEVLPDTGVIAAPSATTFKSTWAEQFAGKEVTIVFDNDEAGKEGMERVGMLIEPFARAIFVVDLEEISI